MRDFFMGESSPGMIDWTTMPTYNTIMSLAAGAGLVALVMFARDLMRHRAEDPISTDGWALTFGALGTILTVTGLHMSLTWPLAAGGFAFDNIIFGETSLGFGVLMSALAILLWRRGERITDAPVPMREVARTARPLSVFIAGLGLALLGIMVAGIVHQLFAAPPQEPVSGVFAPWPLVEAAFMSLLFGLIGVGAVLAPFAIRSFTQIRPGASSASSASSASTITVPTVARVVGVLWLVTGIVFVLFGALNFYTHIGLVVNTM